MAARSPRSKKRGVRRRPATTTTVVPFPDPPMSGMLGTAAAAEGRMAHNQRMAAYLAAKPKPRKTRGR